MSGHLYIIRHGITDWNKIHKLQGRTDIPLSDEGIEMAKKAHEECSNIHFDICFCSPLTRSKQTAEYVLSGRDIPIIYDDRLREMNFGIYEGTTDYQTDPSVKVNVFFRDPEKYTFPVENGENINDLMKRTGEFLDDKVYPLLEEGKDILISGHGAMNSSIICHVKKLPLKDFWKAGIENCKLIRLM